MKMKMAMAAALAAAQLSVATSPAQAGDLPREEAATRQARFEGTAGPGLDRGQASTQQAEPAPEDRPGKKRKSTGDKLLTGAAVVLGVGALAVGGLLIAIFVN
jgi:hypothetical protein